MAKKKTWLAFRIPEKDNTVILGEYLRYAGIVSISGNRLGMNPPSPEIIRGLEITPSWVVITVECPSGLNGDEWAKMNIRRLASFGVKAMTYKSEYIR